MDRETWQSKVHGVAEILTQPSIHTHSWLYRLFACGNFYKESQIELLKDLLGLEKPHQGLLIGFAFQI